MEKRLKAIVEQKGKEILLNPAAVADAMIQYGFDWKEVLQTELILNTCPSVGNLLAQEDITQAEANTLLCSVVWETGLSVEVVRKTLGALFNACGIKYGWNIHWLIYQGKVGGGILPEYGNEQNTLADILEKLEEDPESSEAVSDLQTLSDQGNTRASYALGMLYRKQDEKLGTENGRMYFERAAHQGYGPAYGALAEYYTKGKRRNLAKAAACFYNPTALFGQDGSQWAELAGLLRDYKKENMVRFRKTIILQALLATLMMVMLIQTFKVGIFWTIISVLTGLLGMICTALLRILMPYGSCRYPLILTMISWLCAVLAVC